LQALTDSSQLKGVDLVVNATSIGWHDERFPPLDYAATAPRCVFNDLIYGTSTDFLRRAAAAGRPHLDGAGMLLHQGAAAFRLWTGRVPPVEVMRQAVASK
jgi:shikimate dehydrogenase